MNAAVTTEQHALALDALRSGGTVDDVKARLSLGWLGANRVVLELTSLGLLDCVSVGIRNHYALTAKGRTAWLRSIK